MIEALVLLNSSTTKVTTKKLKKHHKQHFLDRRGKVKARTDTSTPKIYADTENHDVSNEFPLSKPFFYLC